MRRIFLLVAALSLLVVLRASAAEPAPVTTCTQPVIRALSPTLIVAGSRDFILTIYGSCFKSSYVVSFDGNLLKPMYVSSVRIRVTIKAALIKDPRSLLVLVGDPASFTTSTTAHLSVPMKVVTP